VDAPWYIRNDNLHKDLDMETIFMNIHNLSDHTKP
jgi:hypothetical protein